MLIIFFFILGLIFGSFINCLVYRLKTEKTILGRSFCPSCGHILSFKDLFPLLSLVFLKNKCRYCQKKIGWQYFFGELVTGIIFAIGYWFYFLSPWANFSLEYLFFYLFISIFLIILFIYDLKYYLIPDIIVWPAIIISFVFNLFLGLKIENLFLAGLVGAGFFGLQYLVSRGKWIGAGDIFLGLLMGFLLGWPKILIGLFLAYIIGSIIGIFLLVFQKRKWGSKIPFGPFLVVSIYLSLLWGDFLINWYLNLIYAF